MSNSDLDELYRLALMQSTIINNHEITRVPGGWIFKYLNESFMIFIPFIDRYDVQGNVAKI